MHLEQSLAVARLVKEIRELQSQLSDEERSALWSYITDGYCTECGRITRGQTCHCTNDE